MFPVRFQTLEEVKKEFNDCMERRLLTENQKRCINVLIDENYDIKNKSRTSDKLTDLSRSIKTLEVGNIKLLKELRNIDSLIKMGKEDNYQCHSHSIDYSSDGKHLICTNCDVIIKPQPIIFKNCYTIEMQRTKTENAP